MQASIFLERPLRLLVEGNFFLTSYNIYSFRATLSMSIWLPSARSVL